MGLLESANLAVGKYSGGMRRRMSVSLIIYKGVRGCILLVFMSKSLLAIQIRSLILRRSGTCNPRENTSKAAFARKTKLNVEKLLNFQSFGKSSD